MDPNAQLNCGSGSLFCYCCPHRDCNRWFKSHSGLTQHLRYGKHHEDMISASGLSSQESNPPVADNGADPITPDHEIAGEELGNIMYVSAQFTTLLDFLFI